MQNVINPRILRVKPFVGNFLETGDSHGRHGSARIRPGTGRIATAGADPTVGLVFYDLKTLLRQVSEGDGAAVAQGNGDGTT